MGVLASVLVLSVGRADDGNNGQREAGADRALRLLILVPYR